jgi:polysaccharide chain length determinant protein (PEP-CTERM system associated)
VNEYVSVAYGFARAIWRRRWWAVVVAWVVALAVWAVALMLPERYEASARVFVDARTPLRPVLQGIAIQDDYESQLALVREALLSRPQLQTVARTTGLDVKADTPESKEALISALQRQIKVLAAMPVNSSGAPREAIYTITYQHPDRLKAIDVVSTLVSYFVQGTLSGSRDDANQTQAFLNQQIADLEVRLEEAEARLADFKKRNIGMIPGERGDYFSRLSQEMSGLQQAETSLAVAMSRRAELERQLTNERAYLPGAAASSGGGIVNAPLDVTQRRQEAEGRLEDLLLSFTDRHPEVIELRRTIEQLREREAQELAELQRGGAGTGAIRSLAANPIFQQIQVQLSQVQVEIASHQGAIEQHKKEIAALSLIVDQAPEVQQELARLNRDYDGIKDQYEQFIARREQARVTDDAAQTGIVRFDVIEPPRAGLAPVWPKRAALFLGGLVVAIGAGVGIAILPQFLSPTFSDESSLERAIGVPVLGALVSTKSSAQIAASRRDAVRVVIAGGALVALAGLLLVVGNRISRLLLSL